MECSPRWPAGLRWPWRQPRRERRKRPLRWSARASHTAAGPAIENGTIVFSGGVITALGADVSPPGGAEVVDVSGMVIMPGMLDNHSHIGADSRDLNEFPVRFGPQHRIRDVLSPDDAFWKGAVKAA